jgi:TonB family protein
MLLTTPVALTAQRSWLTPVSFDWGGMSILVLSDRAGVSMSVMVRVQGQAREKLAGNFALADVLAWAAAADSLLTPEPLGDTLRWIHPPMLIASDSDALVLGRRRTPTGWDRKADLVYIPHSPTLGAPAIVRLTRVAAEEVLDSLRSQASAAQTLTALPSADSIPAPDRPELLTAPPVAYPEKLRLQGIQGYVMLRSLVDTAGRVDPKSVFILSADDSLFARAARAMIMRARFRPARLDGHPVAVMITMPVNFTLTRD